MKVILVLLILGGIGALALYYGGGYASFDPSEQGRQAKAAIKPGMTWKQVVDAATAPKDYQVFIEQTKRVGNEEVKMVKPGPRNRFKRDVLAGRLIPIQSRTASSSITTFRTPSPFRCTSTEPGP